MKIPDFVEKYIEYMNSQGRVEEIIGRVWEAYHPHIWTTHRPKGTNVKATVFLPDDEIERNMKRAEKFRKEVEEEAQAWADNQTETT